MSNINKGAKKAAKKATAKKKTAKKMAAPAKAPRREDIPGIARDLPDISDWRQAARALKIRPFYAGPKSLPFSCLEATQMRLDKKVGAVTFSYVNDFRLAEHCQS
jgi:hypothetical protein